MKSTVIQQEQHGHSAGILWFVRYCILQTTGFLLNDHVVLLDDST
jgi:hypothetical protein